MRLWQNVRRPEAMKLMLPLIAFATWGLLSAAWSARPALSLAQAGCFGILVLLAMTVAIVHQDKPGPVVATVSRIGSADACERRPAVGPRIGAGVGYAG